MYESALVELEKELGEVRERLAAVQETIARIPQSGLVATFSVLRTSLFALYCQFRRQNSRASALVQTEALKLDTIDGNEQTIDSCNKLVSSFNALCIRATSGSRLIRWKTRKAGEC